jgi:hypothetical protein
MLQFITWLFSDVTPKRRKSGSGDLGNWIALFLLISVLSQCHG